MKNIIKKGLSLVLALVMVAGLLPVTAFAKVENSTGKPLDVTDKLVLSIYTTDGTFPGEPALHDSSEYISFDSNFKKLSGSGAFKSSAASELKEDIVNAVVEGNSNGNNKVWGVFSADGLSQYFRTDSGASIYKAENEAKIIRAVKGLSNSVSDETVLAQYEIVWYVIKMQHSPGSWWWSSGTSEWHIDGLIKEISANYATVNYYGNGNTTGSAPDGVTKHNPKNPYEVLGNIKGMGKVVNNVNVDFLGWNTKADGTGKTYGAGDYITPDDFADNNNAISLYAMWDTNTRHTATVNTYLDGELADDSDIHDTTRDLYLGTEGHYYQLTRSKEGVFTMPKSMLGNV